MLTDCACVYVINSGDCFVLSPLFTLPATSQPSKKNPSLKSHFKLVLM